MKFYKYITLFAAVALFGSCSSDVDTPQISNPDSFIAPVINNCGNIIVNADNSKDETVTFTWKAADFGQPVQILYSLYFKMGDKNAFVGTSSTTSYSISKGDLNGVAINGLGITANTTGTLSAYVTAKIAGTDSYDPISSNFTSDFTVTTYAAPLTWLYLCGEFNNWTIGKAPIFYETSGGTKVYQCMVDFTTTNDTPTDVNRSYFKVTKEQNWAGANWGYNALTPSWSCPEQGDSNLSLAVAEGVIQQVTVNTTVMTIDKKAIGNKLGLMGSFNDWAGDVAFKYNPEESAWLTEPITIKDNGELKVRVDGSWSINWGTAGTMSTAISGGYELKAGADNIKVAKGGTYIVKLHANRTPYVLELIAQ